MHIFTPARNKVELQLVPESTLPVRALAASSTRTRSLTESSPVMRASLAFFDLGREEGATLRRSRRAAPPSAPPAVFREKQTGLLRMVYHEVVVRFEPETPAATRKKILKKHGFVVRRKNAYAPDQVVAAHEKRRKGGSELVGVANDMAVMDEVVFATPNFVSEFRRSSTPAIPAAQWHLPQIDVQGAWAGTRGKPSVVVAVLDDGVDVDHPNLRGRIWKNRSRSSPDRVGRDFFLPNDHPDHFNPRPKKFRFPFDQMAGNDVHGTPCAGVIAAAGKGAFGIAFRCRVLAVKIFHADELAADERVADAIRYAAQRADVLSCSWSGSYSPDLELALVDAGKVRAGRGAPIFCAAGNDYGDPVGYPASDANAIAVGASTDQSKLAGYSNVGPEIALVAPSSGGVRGIFTTDVSLPSRGFNVGTVAAGGADGLHTNDFGGTSSATPLAAGVAALVLSIDSKLSRDDVRDLLCRTTDKIGAGYDSRGHSNRFGFGRVNAKKAVAAARAGRTSRRAVPAMA